MDNQSFEPDVELGGIAEKSRNQSRDLISFDNDEKLKHSCDNTFKKNSKIKEMKKLRTRSLDRGSNLYFRFRAIGKGIITANMFVSSKYLAILDKIHSPSELVNYKFLLILN